MIENASPALFASLVDLQDAHDALLQARDSFDDVTGASPEFWVRVTAFVARAQASGALLDITRDRRAAQSILDYWANALYRADQPTPAARLADFDSMLAPELPDDPCPYQGLAAFGRDQHAFFFGRERLVREMVERLQRGERLLAVVGASGSGKSSVVLAGLLPALQHDIGVGGERWLVRTLTPGSQPLENLAAALRPETNAPEELPPEQAAKFLFAAEGLRRDPDYLVDLLAQKGGPPTLLVIDQFEELFTLCNDETARQVFVRQLLALVDAPGMRHAVILTMRTDFVDNVAKLPALWERWREARADVEALDINELRSAIEGPAALVGLRFEEGIVDDLISTILGERAGLPLLQFTLLKLWQQRRRNRITRGVYAAVGNPRQALERSAEAFFTGLVYEEQQVVRNQLLRMVRPGVGSTEFTSRRLRLADAFQGAAASDRVARVLHRLIFEERLLKLTGAEPTAIDAVLTGETNLVEQLSAYSDAQVEVAHEALVRNWPRLVGWLDEER
ncbi:MAG: ATP-binding protein, partial [Caldilinea sp.]